jgi:hypothetical protein
MQEKLPVVIQLRLSEDHGGSAVEEQKNHRKREGNLRQCDEEVFYRITILLTATPEAHKGPREVPSNELSLGKGQERYEEIGQPYRVPFFPKDPQHTDEHYDARDQYNARVFYHQTN